MQSATLSGEVQRRDSAGIWRTVVTASGHSVTDRRRTMYAMRGYVTVPYVPGKAGAYRPY